MHEFKRVIDLNRFDLTKEYYYEHEDSEKGKTPVEVKTFTLGHLTGLVVNGNLYEKVELPWYENIPCTGLLVKNLKSEDIVLAVKSVSCMQFRGTGGSIFHTTYHKPLTKQEIQVFLNAAPE